MRSIDYSVREERKPSIEEKRITESIMPYVDSHGGAGAYVRVNGSRATIHVLPYGQLAEGETYDA
ncbi:hypothetical protein HYT24_00075 [Candidatus Pacearchaeota archaeon]|nr:hypothetical protein [Candidatus Pacearchaeota archaeon]